MGHCSAFVRLSLSTKFFPADVSIDGHLHDGGTNVIVKVNNKTVCQSQAKYAKGGKEAGTWDALSSMGVCNDMVPVKKGDQLTITAQYDLGLHPARKHAGGGEAEEMGLALFSFAADGTDSTQSFSSFLADMTGYLGVITTVPVVGALATGFMGAMAPLAILGPGIKSMLGF
jgi:hypothetical protein